MIGALALLFMPLFLWAVRFALLAMCADGALLDGLALDLLPVEGWLFERFGAFPVATGGMIIALVAILGLYLAIIRGIRK